jgi:hypothetical protein
MRRIIIFNTPKKHESCHRKDDSVILKGGIFSKCFYYCIIQYMLTKINLIIKKNIYYLEKNDIYSLTIDKVFPLLKVIITKIMKNKVLIILKKLMSLKY